MSGNQVCNTETTKMRQLLCEKQGVDDKCCHSSPVRKTDSSRVGHNSRGSHVLDGHAYAVV